MEDLGNINITIREAAGGRGASGGVGGGPGPGLNPSQREIAEAIASVEASQKQAMAAVQTAQQQIKQPPVQGLQMFAPILRRQEVSAELLNFMRRPSFAGATGLLREGMATRSMLAGLGKTGVTLGAGLLAIGAVAGGVALALGALKLASNHVAQRIEETWRYSMDQTSAMAEQQVMRVAMLAKEAAENGKRYAEVIRAQTRLEQERGRLNVTLGNVTSKITEDFYTSIRIMLKEINGLVEDTKEVRKESSGILDYVPAYWLTSYLSSSIREIDESGLTMLQSLRLSMLRFFGQEELANEMQNEYMDAIAKNTRKDPITEANEWFQADIEHLTGQRF